MTQLPLPLNNPRKTAKDRILEYLADVQRPLAVHEIILHGVSENSIASRLPELALSGKVRSFKFNGEAFKRWQIVRESER